MEDDDIEFAQIISVAGKDKAILPLEARSGIAAKVGVFLSMFGAIEVGMSNMLAELTGASQLEAKAALTVIHNFSARIDHVEKAAKVLPSSAKRDKIIDLLSEVRWLNSERNNYAHAQWGIGKDSGNLFRGSWLTAKRMEQWDVVTPEFVDAHIERGRLLLTNIWRLHALDEV